MKGIGENRMNNATNKIPKTDGRGLSGSTLKIIAIVSMLIDHIGAVILQPLLHYQGNEIVHDNLFTAYVSLRYIGRLAFPIFCFLLVEGFFYTHNRVKYAIRLGIFALISEIPFDLAFYKQFPYNRHQNVFMTLLIGLLMMMAIQYVRDSIIPKVMRGKNMLALLLQTVIFIAAGYLASILHTDYSFWGIIAIFVMYILRFNRLYMCLLEAMYFLAFEVTAAISFIPIYFYNGKRGLKLKYFFYVFYPAHLLILYGIYILYFAN